MLAEKKFIEKFSDKLTGRQIFSAVKEVLGENFRDEFSFEFLSSEVCRRKSLKFSRFTKFRVVD